MARKKTMKAYYYNFADGRCEIRFGAMTKTEIKICEMEHGALVSTQVYTMP